MGKKLVAYFSASGVTEKTVKKLAEIAGADIYEIKPVCPYTENDLNWMDKNSRSSKEMKDLSFRPEIADRVNDIAVYDEVYLGFPIWWDLAPTIVNTFIESYDLTGKKVTVFATSGGSDMRNAERNLQRQYPQIYWMKGQLLNNRKAMEAFLEHMR